MESLVVVASLVFELAGGGGGGGSRCFREHVRFLRVNLYCTYFIHSLPKTIKIFLRSVERSSRNRQSSNQPYPVYFL